MSLQELIQQQAQQCVKCGLCLPSCPTYVQTKNEGHSPRGRIALMEAIANPTLPLWQKGIEGDLASDTHSLNYLDHCLSCRACEAVCPSNVTYGALLDETRALIHEKNPSSRTLPWWARHISQSKKVQALLKISLGVLSPILVPLLRPFRATTFYHVLRATKQLLQWDVAPRSPKGVQAIAPAKQHNVRIALFGGCVSSMLEKNLLAIAAAILTQLGYDVVQPSQQKCCGALQLHQGQPEPVRKMAQKNYQAFTDFEHILFINSACGLTLGEYSSHPLLKDHVPPHPLPVHDVLDFIADHVAQHGWPDTLTLGRKFINKRCVLHVPCSQKNGLKTQGAARLLKLLPNVQLLNFVDAQSQACCGGAGVYFWQHQHMAAQLGQNCLDALRVEQPDIILSTNIGCRLQLAMQLSRKNMYIPILHPLQLLG